MGYERNDVNPCIYINRQTGIELEQHGDDFLCSGPLTEWRTLAAQFREHFLVKKADLIGRDADSHEGHFLKRR
eukprot:707659-Amphidinium_carterae.1